jgi:hypothetical protein
MTDQPQSTAAVAPPPVPPPPPPEAPLDAWQGLQPLRETFLYHIEDPEAVEALRKAGDFFFQVVLEFQGFPDDSQPAILRELGAVARDLRYLQGFLHHGVAEEGRGDMANARYERWLQVKAEEWADTLEEVASEMEQAVAE